MKESPMGKSILGTALAAALVVGGATAATPAPPEREVIPITCGNGESYEIVVQGNGAWTPGRIVGSTGVLVPIAFSFEFTAVTPPPDSTIVEMEFPPDLKGGGNVAARNPRATMDCWFTETFTLDEYDEEFDLPAGTEVTTTGTVTAFLTGR
jgi:hypothetical protein